MGGFFSPGAKAAPTFTGQDRENVVNPLSDAITPMLGNFDYGNVMDAFKTPYSGAELERQGVESLLGMNPESYFQGAQGALGQAQGMVGSDPFGAGSFFEKAMGEDFTDPTKSAQTMKLLDVMKQQGQEAFNIGADKIGSSAASASGGLGQGSAKTDAFNRLAGDVGQSLQNQTAQTLFGEQARLQGIQQSAAQQALGQGNRNAQLMGQLGQLQTGLGQAMGGMDMNRIMGLGDFGQRFAGREMGGAMFPLQQQFALANLLKSGGSVQTPSGFDKMNQGMGFIGSGLGMASGLMGG